MTNLEPGQRRVLLVLEVHPELELVIVQHGND